MNIWCPLKTVEFIKNKRNIYTVFYVIGAQWLVHSIQFVHNEKRFFLKSCATITVCLSVLCALSQFMGKLKRQNELYHWKCMNLFVEIVYINLNVEKERDKKRDRDGQKKKWEAKHMKRHDFIIRTNFMLYSLTICSPFSLWHSWGETW